MSARDVEELLRADGAPASCYVLSEDSDIDGRMLDLHDALSNIVFTDYAGVISCIPGKLALFSDEAPGGQWLLRKNPPE